MELPPWLKIENVIGSLNINLKGWFREWFKGWFNRENNQYVEKQVNIGSVAIYQNQILSPVSLTPEQEDLCRRLDELYSKYNLTIKPSEMFKGVIFASRVECRSNSDWIAQAANSLREILYPFWSSQVKNVSDKKSVALKKYGSAFADGSFIQEVGKLYGLLNTLSHHGNIPGNIDFANFKGSDFEKVLVDFEMMMRNVLTKQIDVHNKIDEILGFNPSQIIEDSTK